MSISPSHCLVPGGGDAHGAESVLSAEVGTTVKAVSPGLRQLSRSSWPPPGLEEVDPQRVHAGGQLHRAVLVLRAVQAVVVDHERLVDEQLGAVVAAQPELYVPAVGTVRLAIAWTTKFFVRPPNASSPAQSIVGLQHVDVRRLTGLDRADLVRRAAELEHAHGDPRFLRRRVLRPRRARGEQREQRARENDETGRRDDARPPLAG